MADFQAGKFEVLVNCMILCLDAETEILTDSGWTGIAEMSFDHNVANYDPESGDVTFEPPLDIVRRPRQPNERMVSLQTSRRSIRVTEGHKMLCRTNPGGRWHKKAAAEMVGKATEIPVSTVATPEAVTVAQEPELSAAQTKRRISAQAYNLRKNNGFDYEESFEEAERRVHRRVSLRHVQPAELTVDECKLIGFFLGDGSRSELQRGGVEYILSQPHAYPAIIEWVDALLERLGLHFVRRSKTKNKDNGIRWSLPRGTGGGSQERDGLFHLESYLDKSFPRAFWGLNEEQFDAMLQGLWMADGNHGQGGEPRVTRAGHQQMLVYQAGTKMLSRLQALAVCRGWRSSLRYTGANNVYYLSLTKRPEHKATKNYALQFEEGWKEETVWCVRTRTSNLVTRRKGTVTLMGNTEGFDDTSFFDEELGEYAPPLDCIMLARPTLSQSLYIQQVGRGTRPAPNKDKLLLLDFSYNSNRHHLVQLPHLFGLEQAEKQTRETDFVMPGPKEIKSIIAAVREARKIDIHKPPPRAGFHWSDTEYGFALSLGTSRGFLLIREAAEEHHKGNFRVWHFAPVVEEGEKASWSSVYRRNCLTTDPLEYNWAFGLAEDSARALFEARKTGRKMSKDSFSEPIQGRIFEREEPWHDEEPTEAQLRVLKRAGKKAKTRKQAADAITALMVARVIKRMEPATSKQLWFLRRNGIPHNDRITMGEASSLIQRFKQATQDSDFEE
jgi:hypothetical protein